MTPTPIPSDPTSLDQWLADEKVTALPSHLQRAEAKRLRDAATRGEGPGPDVSVDERGRVIDNQPLDAA